MPNITILTLVYAPDGVSTARLISELSESLRDRGHRVSVLTTAPHYNLDEAARAAQPLEKKWGGLYYRSQYSGNINVWHTAMLRRAQGAGTARRTLGYLIFHVISLLLGLLVLPRQDVILVISPPLTSGVVGQWLARAKGARLVYNIQELYPDTFVRVGTLRKDARITRWLYALERHIYRVSDALTPIGEVLARSVAEKDIPDEKVHVIPNFVDVDLLRPGPKDNPFTREVGLSTDDFIVLYAGNIGMTQSFDTLLAVAERLHDIPQVKILIVGDGVKRDDVARTITEKQLHNVVLHPHQPYKRVPDIYATGDLGLVPLMRGAARVTLPSKLYTIMATGTPILAAVDEDSDIVTTVRAADAGYCVPPDDADALEAAIREAFANRDKLAHYGENARRHVQAHFSREAVADQYDALLRDLSGAAK